MSHFHHAARNAAALAILAFHASAQAPPLFAPVESGPARGRTCFAAADFDGDGDLDIVTSLGSGNGFIQVERNEGGGRFRTEPGLTYAFPAGASIASIKAADFDGDGKVDLAARTVASSVNVVRILRNLGGGVFTQVATLTSTCLLCASSVDVADFDGDGLPDLTFAQNGTAPRVVRNLGGMTFQDVVGAVPASTSIFYGSVFAGDADLDGDVDLLLSDNLPYQPPQVLLNNGAGIFSTGAALAAAPSGSSYKAIGAGDFDGDGSLDVVLETQAPPAFAVVEKAYSFATGAAVLIGVASRSTVASKAIAFDLDGVAPPEILRSSLSSFEIVPLIAGGVAYQPLPGSYFPFAFDADGDGDTDLSFIDGLFTTRVFMNAGGSFADTARVLPTDLVVPAVTFVKRGEGPLADLDGDGDLDLVAPTNVVAGNSQQIVGAMNDGTGLFTPSATMTAMTPTPSGFVSAQVISIAVDLNGDGAAEVVDASTSGVWVHAPTGSAFASYSAGVLNGAPTGIVAADLDGDGDPDVAVGTSTNGGGFTRFLNVAGALVAQSPFSLFNGGTDLAAVDLNADGDIDLVQAMPNGGSLAFVNQGSGSFTFSFPFTGVGAGKTATSGDLDGDGDLDLVLGDQVWFMVGGALVAGPAVAPSPDPSVENGHRRLVDLDGDGVLDLLLAGVWRHGMGAGVFGPDIEILQGSTTLITSRSGTDPWFVGDIDGDGDVDLFSRFGFPVLNTRRQLAIGATPAIGRVGTLEVYGPANEPWLLFATAGGISAPVAIPGLGSVYLDLATLFPITGGVCGANGEGEIAFAIPNVPTFVGESFSWQAVLLNVARLTPARTTTLTSY